MRAKCVLVCGAGDWVCRQYAPALQGLPELTGGEFLITFDSRYPHGPSRLSRAQLTDYHRAIAANVETLRRVGVRCLDISDAADVRLLAGTAPDIAFVVTPPETHCDVATSWMSRAAAVVVEKPFATSVDAIHQLKTALAAQNIPTEMAGFDHYLVRAQPLWAMWQDGSAQRFLQERIRAWRFHMLEPCAGADIRRRLPSLQDGMVLDLGAHGIALLPPAGDPATIEVQTVKAGVSASPQHAAIRTSGRDLLVSGMETFADVTFTFTSIFNETTPAYMRVGKFVGSDPEKFLEIRGGREGDRSITLDFVHHRITCAQAGGQSCIQPLPREPVASMIHTILRDGTDAAPGLIPINMAIDITSALTALRRPIVARVFGGRPLEEYPAGAPAEAIAANLPVLSS